MEIQNDHVSRRSVRRISVLRDMGLVMEGKHEAEKTAFYKDERGTRVISISRTEYFTENPGTPNETVVTAYIPSRRDMRALVGRRV